MAHFAFPRIVRFKMIGHRGGIRSQEIPESTIIDRETGIRVRSKINKRTRVPLIDLWPCIMVSSAYGRWLNYMAFGITWRYSLLIEINYTPNVKICIYIYLLLYFKSDTYVDGYFWKNDKCSERRVRILKLSKWAEFISSIPNSFAKSFIGISVVYFEWWKLLVRSG